MENLILEKENLSERARKRLSILDAIRRSGPISKTEISSIIGVNVVTVSNYVEDFLRQKLIFEKELDISKGGRRPVLLDLNARSGYAIGIGFNLLGAIGVVVDMKGEIIYKLRGSRPDESVSGVISAINELIKALLSQCVNIKDKISGIGIGMAGIVDNKRDTVRWPQKQDGSCNYTLVSMPLKHMLEREFSLPVCIENDATAACFGESWLDTQLKAENLLYMFSGAGCGIMIGGEVYRGASGCAGELFMGNLKNNGSSDCQSLDNCLFSRQALDIGIIDLIKSGFNNHKESKLWEMCDGSLDNLDLNKIFEATEACDIFVLDVIKKCARRLGIKISFLVNLLNPEIVIIGGGLERIAKYLIEEIKQAISEWSFQEASSIVKIIPSRLGEDAVALGAASLIVRQALAGPNIKE